MTTIDWSIEGPHVANCNCDTGCPCQFMALPTDGTCKAVVGWQIDKGHFGETRLDGLLAVNYALAVLSKIMSLAEAWGLRSGGSNPCIHVKRYRENKRERFLSTSELQALGQTLADADRTSTEPWQVTATVRLLILTGARLSEICELAWKQVDLDAGLIRMPETKTGSRVIYVTAPVAEVMEGLPRSEDISWVVPGIKEPSKPLSIATVEHGWRRIKKKANILDVRLHDLRHSHASVAASAGLSLPIIGKILGHNTPTTTARYAHLIHSAPSRRGWGRPIS